ncbi:MAG: L-aspartate semialdehyde sulfurtransferase ferredoxin [Chloroflexota bacterium]|jgi:ABC-type methionine transport system ATPase subunit|nr:L-aspartate semialdehyde sulfurtransferase ferredoxin [Chloroflexota bacterium]
MGKRRIRLFFSPQLITEPVVYQMGKQFEVVTNIRGGEIAGDSGWLYLEVNGDDDEIDRAIEWAIARGVRVDPVEGDIIAG